MTGYLSTPERVRHRLGFVDITLTDATIQEFIDDAQAYAERFCGRIFMPADDDYGLAVSVVTDIAAMYCIIRPAGGQSEGIQYTIDELTIKKDKQLEMKLRTADKFKAQADAGLNALKTETQDLVTSSDQLLFGL